jgi:uncharacterized membrane protein
MKRLRSFVSITFIGGFMVVLPLLIFAWLVEWLLDIVRGLISPLSQWLVQQTLVASYVADVFGVLLLLVALFLVGLFVSTSIGGWIHDLVDHG